MRIRGLGIDKDLPTVVVLGAGASRGSSCARSIGIAPPLDTDFFAQAQRMPATMLDAKDRELFAFIRSEFGQTSFPTLEVFFTQIAAVDRFHHEFNIRGRPSGKFGQRLETLRSLIPRVFQEALGGLECAWHTRIAAALRAGDAVLSFNYDTLMDRALREVGGKRWVPSVGYGFATAGGDHLWAPPPKPGPTVKNPILLLKPHGSLNWELDSNRRVSLVDEYVGSTAQSIVPPTWDKSDVTSEPWNEVWRASRNVLGLARMLIVVGYSVPVTDQLSQALLRADVTRLESLVIVNPDASARTRVVDLLSSGLHENAVVSQFDTLEQFASYLEPSATEETPPDAFAELEELRTQLDELAKRIDDMAASGDELQNEIGDLEVRVGQAEEQIENAPTDEIARLRSEVEDLDARLDSLLRP